MEVVVADMVEEVAVAMEEVVAVMEVVVVAMEVVVEVVATSFAFSHQLCIFYRLCILKDVLK